MLLSFDGVFAINAFEPVSTEAGVPISVPTVDEATLHILHKNEGSGTFVDETASHDLDLNIICAEVDSLSPFVVATGPPTACLQSPLSGCRAAEKSILILKNNADDAKDKLVWKWIKGETTSQTEFADPLDTATYSLCIYAGVTPSLIADAAVLPSALKWQTKGTTGFKFKDQAGVPDGIQKVTLKGSDQNKAKIIVKGKGALLPDPAMPPLLPVLVQLSNSDSSACWESSLDAGDVKKAEENLFKAKDLP